MMALIFQNKIIKYNLNSLRVKNQIKEIKRVEKLINEI
jgi:hypothetical protein